MSKTFNVSVFRIASRIHGNFSSFDKNVAVTVASMLSTKRLSILLPSEYLCVFGTSP
ncbi:MAG: hypothetical protein WCW03_02050 [Candidatus Paceibacterota bacterium]